MGRSRTKKQPTESRKASKQLLQLQWQRQRQRRGKSDKSLNQDLLSSSSLPTPASLPTRCSKYLNAVMQMDRPGARRRVARNPIVEQVDTSPSPTDADSSNDAAAGPSSNSAECRRSSRKKTIKFDVRDLLNKNRKNHKIQIEARIDSNAPIKVGADQVSKAELDSKQKNFIEKSAIFRRYSISENKLPPRPPPPPGALIHTIQQCVGELEQLPLEGGELNMAAISPIARRLSRTQDILTASMIKPKQVSSLIVTKLESATTSCKVAAAAPTPTTSAPRGRPKGSVAKAKAKAQIETPAVRRNTAAAVIPSVAAEDPCEPSTSSAVPQKAKRGRKPKTIAFVESSSSSSSSFSSVENSIDSFDSSANKQELSMEQQKPIGSPGIDLKESLDASAVTLPPPAILEDCRHSSTDESFVAAEDDLFSMTHHSSDESTNGSFASSPKGSNADKISLFGRSNSTETTSSEDSEKRRRKIRVSVKRVSLTPQKSPPPISISEEIQETNRKPHSLSLLFSANDDSSNEGQIISKPKSFKPSKLLNESSRATPVISLDGDTSNTNSISSSVIEISSCNSDTLKEDSLVTRRFRNFKLHEDTSALQKSTTPVPAESIRSSPRKSPNLSIETIDIGSSSASLTQLDDEEKEIVTPQGRSLRSAQSAVPPAKPSTSSLKRQKKSNKTTETPDNYDQSQAEASSDKEVVSILSHAEEAESGSSFKSHLKDDDEGDEPDKKLTRSQVSKKLEEAKPEDRIDAKRTPPPPSPQTDKNSKKPAEQESEQSDRRESPRLRSLALTSKQQQTSKKSAENSSTPDSSSDSSEVHERSSKNRKQIKPADETSSLCSESSVVTSSSSSTSSSTSSSHSFSSSASTSSSSSSSSSSSTSTSTSTSTSASVFSQEVRSTRSSANRQKNLPEPQSSQPVERKPPTKSSDIKSDSESSELFSKSDRSKAKTNDVRLKELGKLMEKRKTARMNRWSSEHERESDGSESSDGIQGSAKIRSGRSRGRIEKKNKIEETRNNNLKRDSEFPERSKIEENANPETPTGPSPRTKSKKRTRRFVPIKYSSSESGTLSDDGNSPSKEPNRLTRTRRKTISSASELEEFISVKLSTPSLALEYGLRKTSQKKKEEDAFKNEEHEQESKSKLVKSRKESQSASRNPARTNDDESADISKESEKNQTSKDKEPESPSSPSSSESSLDERETKALRQRKLTRLSLKTQAYPRDDQSYSMPILKPIQIDKTPECNLNDQNSQPDKTIKSPAVPCETTDNNKEQLSVQTDFLDSKSVKQKQTTKSSPKSPMNKTTLLEKPSDPSKDEVILESPSVRRTTRSSPKRSDESNTDEILSEKTKPDNNLQEQIKANDEAPKPQTEPTKKETRLSTKKLEPETEEKKTTETDSSTPSQAKPSRFSSKASEEPRQPEESPAKDTIPQLAEEPQDSSSKLRKTKRAAQKSLDLQHIEVSQQQKEEVNLPETLTDCNQLKLDNVKAIDCALDNKTLDKPLMPEQVNNCAVDALKLVESPIRRRKPTRFSPKSPDKHKDSEEKVDEPPRVPPDDDAIKQTEEPNAILTTPVEIGSEQIGKSPKARKGTRFSAKIVENIQVPEEIKETKESQLPEDVEENKPKEPSESEIGDVSASSLKATQLKEPLKAARGRKANNNAEEECNKVSDDPQLEALKTTRTRKAIRSSILSAITDSLMSEDSSKPDPLIKAKPEDPLKASRKARKFVEKESDVSMTSTSLEDQTNSIKENDAQAPTCSSTPSQETSQTISAEATKETSAVVVDEQQLALKEAAKKLVETSAAMPESGLSPQPALSIDTKKGLKKKLQSMLDSLKSQVKQSPQKAITPRRKKKPSEQHQQLESAQDSSTSKKIDESNQEAEMKIPLSDANQSDDSLKSQEPATKIDPKTPSRRQLDSSFIKSLEKSLLRPKKSSKKAEKEKEKEKEREKEKEKEKEREKEKEAMLASSPKLKEEPLSSSKKSTPIKKPLESIEDLKKSETSSPKLKKKHNKESSTPKTDKKSPSDDQSKSKKKPKQLSEIDAESSFSKIFEKHSTEPPKSSLVVSHQTPTLKTKAETKFFSPEKTDKPINQVIVEKDQETSVETIKEKSPDLLPDPLKDIEKFIEDGVNLLKRCYKIDADDDTSLDKDILKTDQALTPKKSKLDETIPDDDDKSQNTPPHDENSNSNSESSTMTTNTSTSEIDTPNGIRRSHRIKNNSKSTKCLVGRGLVRERERFSTKDDEKTIYSIDDQKMDLAEVEAKNSQFLKDMEERLSNFRVIRENEYKCERVISKEAKRMLCDCFLTHEEEERGELGCGEDCLNRLLMIECGTDCTVRERCTNRRFNKFLYSPCRVFRTEKKGFGIMADIEILPGEFIMEYVGEVINGDEFEFRINEYSKDKNKHYYFMALRSDAVIDATAKGNISRFINHSCEPNAETQKWTVNGELRIGFFSRKSIMPGEEITFDYQYQRYGKEAQRCYCESSNCRGWIGAEPSSEEEEYEGVDEEDESEESEEEEPTEMPVLLPAIPIPPVLPVVGVADVEQQQQPLVPVVATEVPILEVKPIASPQPVPPPTPITEPAPIPTIPVVPKEKLPKKKKEKKRLLEEKIKRREPKQFLEDPDIEDEVRFLVKCGLRNQADTLRLSRLIVRAKLLETRIKLLQILRKGELACRRLFLDYHGLRLLHGWMSEVIDTRDTDKNMEIRMELLSVLECLPISNKTMLCDSKVYQTVRDWSNNKESHSPSDGSPKEGTSLQDISTEDVSSELQKLAAKLVHTWDNLPEVFRIPKRERIEQMKEHEREADRQYRGVDLNQSRNRERFMSKSGKKRQFNWLQDKERRERVNERRKFTQNTSSAKDATDKSAGSLPGESSLSKEQRRELFAAKVARDEAEKRQAEERREFDIKCRFFGLDPKRIRPENMPFCVNPSTGQWYSTDKKPISTPPSYAHVQVPVKPKSTNPEDYRLPVMDLPPLWKFAISPKGKIYYYHVKIRIPQWEPPIKILPLAGQRDKEVKSSESDSSNPGIIESSEDDIEVIKGLDPVKLQAYIEKKIEDRRVQRYTRLVEEKSISPRKEEDRIYNQMEVRKYKENKEKIRKRKEEIRRRRDIIGKPQTGIDSSNLSETTETDESLGEALPIQDYLLSSEEEDIIKAECNNSPLIDMIVQGDKIVDELDALHRKRSLKRSLPIKEKYEHKKRKLDKNKDSSKSTKRSKDGEGSSSSSSKYRKVREKFRGEIGGIIVQHLKPYRSETCFSGRILTDDDFNHLARKLTHFVMVKELKYCESIGQTLIVTESVKNKSREFIKKYMAKYGKVYVRPKNDPEFKDIPFL